MKIMLVDIKNNILNRPLCAVISFYILGIFISHIYGITNTVYALIVLALFSVLIVFRSIKNKNLQFLLYIFCILFFLSGIFQISSYEKSQKSLENIIGNKAWVSGTVISSPELSSKGNHYSIIVKMDKIEIENEENHFKENLLLFVAKRDNSAPKINERIMFVTEFTAPDFKKGTFDYSLYLKTKNIYLTGFTDVVYPDNNPPGNNSLFSKFMYFARNLRENISFRLEHLFSYDADACAIIKGILLGDKSYFSETLTENFSTSGISHIAAVSGLHLSILFSVLCGLLGFFKIRKKFVSIVILPTILIFSAVTGFSPSVCRAVIMLTMYLFALITKRQYDSITALFISAFIFLAVNPYSLFDVSFILSCVSTLAIIVIYPIIYRKASPICKENKFIIYLISSLAISISVLIATAPFVAYYFGRISLFSIIANTWVVALCAPIFVLGYVLCLLSVFIPKILYSFILYPLATLIEIIILTTELSLKTSFLSPTFPSFSPYWMILYYSILLFILGKLENKKAPQ